MEWTPWMIMGAILLDMLVVGVVLLLIWHRMQRKAIEKKMRFLEKLILTKGKAAIVQVMSECLDILPEKILEVKQTIEGGM